MTKKTNRRNKKNLVVNWPTETHFDFKALRAQNSHFEKEITLRTRLESAKLDGKIAEIGCMHCKQGRPTKVYTMMPVSKSAIDAAELAGVDLLEAYTNIVSINTNIQPFSGAPSTPVPASER